ncbi:hypothetical protein GCM10010232_50280 [Streptomyces amakusaensis]|uniref:MarR family transcriptional regulator n=1 Tax=Streptomyces amakusaensis TaxID=67271 RepID=A0ABW0AJS4_9ACTN
MNTPSPSTFDLGELLLLADRATNLADSFHLLEGADRDVAVGTLTFQVDAAEQLALGLRQWAGTGSRLRHDHPRVIETADALRSVAHHARLVGDHLVQALMAHGRRAEPGSETPDIRWEAKLYGTAGEQIRAARSLLALIPATCADAAATFAATVPYTAPAAGKALAGSRAGSLTDLQGAALRSAAAGRLELYAVGPSTYLSDRGRVRLTRRTVNPLVERGLLRYDDRFARDNTWRIRLTPPGRAMFLGHLARPRSRTAIALSPPVSLRQRTRRP